MRPAFLFFVVIAAMFAFFPSTAMAQRDYFTAEEIEIAMRFLRTVAERAPSLGSALAEEEARAASPAARRGRSTK